MVGIRFVVGERRVCARKTGNVSSTPLLLFHIGSRVLNRGLVTEAVSIDASAEDMEAALEALPTVSGGVTVTREVNTQTHPSTTSPALSQIS